MNPNTMLMLVRREFWEHRSLWIAPLVWVAIIVLVSMWGTIITMRYENALTIGSYSSVAEIPDLGTEERQALEAAAALPDEHKATMYAATQLVITFVILMVTLIVVFFYLVDCLYSERRDRSILFWKSLPVSDLQVVLSKLLVALVVMPLLVLAAAAVTQVLVSIIFWVRFHDTVLGAIMPAWSFTGWVSAFWAGLLFSLCGVLWYVPVAAYLLLVSAWARRNAFLWAVLPPAALMLLEVMFFHSHHVAEFVGRRFAGFIHEMRLDGENLGTQAVIGDMHMPTLSQVYDAFHVSGVLLSTELWLGVVAGAALLAATVRIRRYRDDS